MKRLCSLAVFAIIAACGGAEDTASVPPGSDTAQDPTNPGASSGTPGASSGTPGAGDSGSPLPATPKAVRFIAMGDTGVGTTDQLKVGNAIAAFCAKRGCDFVQLLGDNLYQSGASSTTDPIWQTHFETPYAAIDLDFFAVLGNHDYGANGAGTDFPRGQNEIDYTAKSKKWKMPAAFYHHAPATGGGAVEIFALDTNKALFGQDGDQRKDVAAWLTASKADWKIAVGHHPYKSNGPHGNAGSYDAKFGVSLPPVNGVNVKSYLEDTICGKVDLYLSGHDHSRQWMNESCKGTALAVSGAGAKATDLGGKNPSLFESVALGFLYIVIEGKKLTAEFVDENGKTDFTHTMQKP